MTPEAQKLADRYWPGPLTMVLKKKPRCGGWVPVVKTLWRCDARLTLGARAACAYGGPKHRGLTAPSANSFGRISRRQLSMYVKTWAKNPPASSI